ncbi:MAG: TonB-dependent receptor [Acidobacteriota bacterium]|nr:TonB-dependent receptor [Acidobacteriota bacterium]
MSKQFIIRFFSAALFLISSTTIFAQALGTAGTISGTVTDPNGAVVVGANLTIKNAVTGFTRAATSDADGNYSFQNVPPNNYQITVSASGFANAAQNIVVRASVPMQVPISLAVSGNSAVVDVTSDAQIVENIPTTHTDVDSSQISKLPLSSPGNGLSEAVTLTSPGVVADSNGFFHPLGDHAQTQYSIDNQPITDQQSKAFSTQIPVNAIQSLEVITGATPAEYGDKSSLVINAITRSGLNQTKPSGSFTSTFGSFKTVQEEAALAFGNSKLGNFTAFNFERSNRFLDAPEFVNLHDTGNSINLFNRTDYSPTTKDTLHLNLFLARNKFEIANTYEQEALGQNQRQRVKSINIAPGYVHIFSSTTVLTINPYFRLDQVNYFPSANPFSDQTTTVSQSRRLLNTGVRGDVAYVKGIHNIKIGGQFQSTFLNESFQFGITDPNFNNPTSPDFLPGLLPFDLTRGGRLFNFNGHTNIKQQAAFAQDALNFKNGLTISVGLRFDNYDGISKGKSLQPRVGVSYLFKPTNTVVRASYTRNFETPYNENLILSNSTGAGGLADGILGDTTAAPLKPGNRNQYNVGIQQGIGKYIVADVDYFNKFTRNAYDFNVLLNTPITFPISWDKSKIDGVSFRLNLTNYKGLSAFFNASHTRARFFPPETGGLFFNSDLPSGAFRIDHDQAFQQTTQIQYSFDQFKTFHKFAPFVAFTWRYDSGLVSGAVADYNTALGFSADEQQQIGLFCGNQTATLTNPIRTCSDTNRGAIRVRIPADGTENDDTNPPRIAPRNLFDLSFGSDNVLRTDKMKMSARLTFVNLTNKETLYNFNSTFSGTHFVTPRSIQGQIGITF